MGIWKMSQLKAPPQTNDAGELREYIKYFSNQIAIMLKDLDFTLNGDINFQNVKAKSITADRMNVKELSAIAADIGHITAGLIESIEIYGSYIATSKDSFPRCEMSSTGNVFAAKSSAEHYIAIEPDYAGTPALQFFFAGSERGRLNDLTGTMELTGVGGLILGSAGGDITMLPSGQVTLANFYKLLNNSTGLSLGDELDDIKDRLSAGGL
ncbi:hypothetical protein BSK62_13120 [Paenibacillus odorifer]|uniref:hypothetical protein n=1 Tax=Paenibacillus odorifer TaxID=189426 RepID=UPI00096F9B1D|nr:hypothetical protein [Paenibacillus odorifer]OMD66003.1 hypothetical protein BSK62_13120 [Paenibacillus odorifer]